MEEILKRYKDELPELNIEKKEYSFSFLGAKQSGSHYNVNGFAGNPDFRLRFETEGKAEELFEIARKKPFLFNDFLAVQCNNIIEVLLTSVSPHISIVEDEGEPFTKFLELNLSYHRNEIKIELETGQNKENTLPKLLDFIFGARRYARRGITILKIYNYKTPTSEGIENDVRNIINSVLFDIEISYLLAFETVNIEGLLRRGIRRRQKKNDLPGEPINLVYKKYIPELIQYFHTAEKVDFLPFKYITYYHIIEYFSDKSAYRVVSQEVKKLLLKPDFHIKTNHYVNQAINIFKKENERLPTDKKKIDRVLKQFVDREALKEFLLEYKIIEHFENAVTLDCAKSLNLPAIKFDTDGGFYDTLTKRIYSLRCSIVHSNPDFDESKGIPFLATPRNLEILRTEIEIIAEIARNIIIDSKEG